MKNNIQDFGEVYQKGKEFYETIGKVFCPYFQSAISFNELGMEHLHYKKREKFRPEQDQYMRFKLISYAPEIIKRSHTIQGLLETSQFEKVRSHNKTEYVMKFVRFYEFIAVIKRSRIKIIVKQIGDGEKFFWSIIPFWGMDITTKSRILHDGVPEED